MSYSYHAALRLRQGEVGCHHPLCERSPTLNTKLLCMSSKRLHAGNNTTLYPLPTYSNVLFSCSRPYCLPFARLWPFSFLRQGLPNKPHFPRLCLAWCRTPQFPFTSLGSLLWDQTSHLPHRCCSDAPAPHGLLVVLHHSLVCNRRSLKVHLKSRLLLQCHNL